LAVEKVIVVIKVCHFYGSQCRLSSNQIYFLNSVPTKSVLCSFSSHLVTFCGTAAETATENTQFSNPNVTTTSGQLIFAHILHL